EDGPHELGEDATGGVGGPSRRGPRGGHQGAAVDGAGVDAEGGVADGAGDEAAGEEGVRGAAAGGRGRVAAGGGGGGGGGVGEVGGGGRGEGEAGGGGSLRDEGVALEAARGAVGVAMERERCVERHRAPQGDLGGAVDVAGGEAGAVAAVAAVERAIEAARD